jgi:hypothetical protein
MFLVFIDYIRYTKKQKYKYTTIDINQRFISKVRCEDSEEFLFRLCVTT